MLTISFVPFRLNREVQQDKEKESNNSKSESNITHLLLMSLITCYVKRSIRIRELTPSTSFLVSRVVNRSLNVWDRAFCHHGVNRWLYVSDLTVSVPS